MNQQGFINEARTAGAQSIFILQQQLDATRLQLERANAARAERESELEAAQQIEDALRSPYGVTVIGLPPPPVPPRTQPALALHRATGNYVAAPVAVWDLGRNEYADSTVASEQDWASVSNQGTDGTLELVPGRPETPEIQAYIEPPIPPEAAVHQDPSGISLPFGNFTTRAGYIWAKDSPTGETFYSNTIQEWTETTDQGLFHRQRAWHPPTERYSGWFYSWGASVLEPPRQSYHTNRAPEETSVRAPPAVRDPNWTYPPYDVGPSEWDGNWWEQPDVEKLKEDLEQEPSDPGESDPEESRGWKSNSYKDSWNNDWEFSSRDLDPSSGWKTEYRTRNWKSEHPPQGASSSSASGNWGAQQSGYDPTRWVNAPNHHAGGFWAKETSFGHLTEEVPPPAEPAAAEPIRV